MTMNEAEIRERKAELEARFGPWTAHNIPLGHGINTSPQRTGPHLLIRRTIQAVSDLSMKPWRQLRVLDLGSLEGLYALEFASQGAQVVAIEGRQNNNVHARFAAEALGLANVEFFTDDVRNISEDKYGRFDVVILLRYSLPPPRSRCLSISPFYASDLRTDHHHRHTCRPKTRELNRMGRSQLLRFRLQ